MKQVNRKEQFIEIFEDTRQWCQEENTLIQAIEQSVQGTKVYKEGEEIKLPTKTAGTETKITVTPYRTLQAAGVLHKENPEKKIAVHNFASGTNPGGGVTKGSSAQEECLCRCSTLHPVLKIPMLWKQYYKFHRERHDTRYTDTCIYTPEVYVIKTDTETPVRMERKEWYQVDVLTCAAPNLRLYSQQNNGEKGIQTPKVSDKELLELHKKRARHMLSVAAANGAEILVLGAFGCGAFQNKPEIVARAYREILEEFQGRFQQIEFAVYCTKKDTRNYEVFRRMLKK